MLSNTTPNNDNNKGRKSWLLTVSKTTLSLILLAAIDAHAAISNVTATDVTTRALSVVWASDEPVISATLQVYSDTNGNNDISNSLTITIDSNNVPNAHTNGIVKATAIGLDPNTDYFIQTITTGASGPVTFPSTAPLIKIHTATQAAKANASNAPIVNDLLIHPVYMPDGSTPAPGALVLVAASGLSGYPLSAFVGENGVAAPQALIDTNNFYDNDGVSLALQAGDALQFTVMRGLICADEFDKHSFKGFRRNPNHEESPAITEVETTLKCYDADPVCDNDVNVQDVQFVLNVIDNAQGECGFNPFADVVADGDINVQDVQRILNEIDTAVPNQN